MKKFILILSALWLTASTYAASVYDKVIVNLNDGAQVEIKLGENLKMSFNDKQLVVTGSDSDVSIDRENIKNFVHDKYTAVEQIEGDASYSFSDNCLNFTALPDDTIVMVFDTTGKVIKETRASGECTISLDDLAAGVYVVKAGNNSFKILIK